jgi:hypothetical protein
MRRLATTIIGLLAVSIAVMPAAAAQPAPSPDVIEIDAEIGPGVAVAVNRQRVVAGHTDGKPWVWRRGTRTYLPTLGGWGYPHAINDRGDVVGTASIGTDGPSVGIRWTRGRSRPQELAAFDVAFDINDRGEIVGHGSGGALHYWKGRTTKLAEAALAYAIDRHGRIVGEWNYAVVWHEGSVEFPLEPFGPWGSEALDVSSRGHLVGNLWGDRSSGFRLSPDGTYEELVPGWLEGSSVRIRAVDRFGRAVGHEYTPGPQSDEDMYSRGTTTALVWLPGSDRPIRLGSHPDDEARLGRSPSSAFDINDRGVVVGCVGCSHHLGGAGATAVIWEVPR